MICWVQDLMDCDLLDVLTHWSPSDRAIYKKEWIAQIVSYFLPLVAAPRPFTPLFLLGSQATGIAAIHNAGILHRDIKPENILIDFRRNIRLADFGCAFINTDNKPLRRYGEYCTHVCGTWPYQAPELLANDGKAAAPVHRRKYGIPVDYWALGCIIFELEVEETRVSVHLVFCC